MSGKGTDAAEDTGGTGSAANGGASGIGAGSSSSNNKTQAPPKQVEKIVLQYLKSKGYKDAEQALREDAMLEGNDSTLGDLASAFPASEIGADASVPNWILFYNEAEQGNPDAYRQSYRELRRWIDSSLDAYKHELYAASYPIFVHSYLDLHTRGLHEKAAEFMELYSGDHTEHHGQDIGVLKTLTTKAHVEENELAKVYRENKYGVRMTRVGLELLLSFLQDHEFTLLMRAVNQHLNIRTVDGAVPISSQREADVGITGHTQNQLDEFNRQEVMLGSVPLDSYVRDEVERTLQDEAGRADTEAARTEASALLETFSRVKQEAAASALSSRDAVPLPPARGPEVEQQIADLKALRKRVALGPAALPSVCMYTLHNTDNTLNCTTVSEDLSLLAGGFSESYIKLWSLTRTPLRGFQSTIASSTISSEEDVETARERTTEDSRRLVGHSGAVFGVDISFDSKYLISGSEDRTARLWSLDTFTNVVCYKGHNYPIWDVAFAPQGFYFATASHDRTARLWSCDHIYALRIFAGHLSDVNCVRFHPNSKYVVTGSSDKSVRLWDVQRGSCVRVFTGHTGSVDTVAISPDGRIMASAGEDQTVAVWDLGSGRRMESLTAHTGPVYSLAFSQEGTLLLSASADETVRAWDVKRAAAKSAEEGKKRDAAGIWKSKRVAESEALLRTWRTKSTPVYSVMMTKRNLAVATGAFAL
ncbi:WD40 repeat-like protein [Coemansia reversa NRRL 1564]|uniref:WD40 repeat-like protein n=1 Tax=Coemansia reversa (strain ATCC 12441 / NRRL 1564) TaxID=763665 RepID=A0A2G5B4T4_COERN|nr:WD40 repeat-like protein [Coemansia reversa NRRL 1564]|eukprot:PIA14010.1 WD40 repeat-like protein [Coemansia reversa NRRL 1564]